MRSRIPWVIGLSLLLIPGALFADSPTLSVDDVLRLHFAGVSDEVIISEIIVTGSVFELDVDDILRLKEAGLSERLIKFMIDTGLTDQAVSEEDQEYSEQDGFLDEDVGLTWVNTIEEEPTETTYIASLNYNYGSWWYDYYWDDYWYYDFHYAPYRCSYVYSFGVWYPTWYAYWNCYSPPHYGYRSWYWHHWGNPYAFGGWWGWDHDYYWYNDPYYHHHRDDNRYHHPSSVKYKQGSSSGGKIVSGGGKLKMNDGSRVTATKQGQRLADSLRKNRRGDVLVADGNRSGDRVRRPVKSAPGSPRVVDGRDGRQKVTAGEVGDRAPDRKRTPVRGVRAPASGTRPTKIRVEKKRPSGATPSAPDRVESPPNPRGPSTQAPTAPSKPEVKQTSPPSAKPKASTPAPPKRSTVKPSKPTRTAPRATPEKASSRTPKASPRSPKKKG